jgi:hypothetical protein
LDAYLLSSILTFYFDKADVRGLKDNDANGQFVVLGSNPFSRQLEEASVNLLRKKKNTWKW